MTGFDIPRWRLDSQHISDPRHKNAAEVVGWLGAVQAQDYAAAKWALAQRARGLTDSAIDQALADGSILRTHILRPTWHFVLPEDIRWMLALTAPRVRAVNATMDRQLGLDAATFKRSHSALTKALQGGRQLTRAELADVLQKSGIPGVNLRFIYLMIRAELDGLIVSGGRRGKQFTYALLDERAPQAKPLPRDEALAELTRRYFTSRGPATLKDFVWWSGLTMADARRGVEMLGSKLMQEDFDGTPYWFGSTPRGKDLSPSIHLLPNYDEYVVGYTDRSAIFDTAHAGKLDSRGNVLFMHTILIDGRIRGTWKRALNKRAVVLELSPFAPLTKAESRALQAAANRYGKFHGLPAVIA
jgi:hypothetical protein